MAFAAGAAFVTVRPSLEGFHKQIGRDLNRSLMPAAAAAGTTAGRSMSTGIRRSTANVGANVGTLIASGIGAATDKVGGIVGRRIHAGFGQAIARTGESAGLRIGTGIESAVNASMARVEQRGRTTGSRLYAGFRAPIAKIGGLGASVFGRFGLNASSAAALAGTAAIGMGVRFAAGMEQAQQGFTTMLGSAQRARAFLDQLAAFAAKTPFEFTDLVRASQRMIAFGFQSKQVIPTLTAIGDAAAGLGVGAEGVNQLVNAIGQIQAKGKVQTDELLQLTEVGVPALRILANQFGVSTTKMQQMVTAGLVPASKAIPALLTGISKGTKGAAGQTTAFAGLMERQSHTLTGVWSNFVDVTNQRLGQFVAPALPFVKQALSGLTSLIQGGLTKAFSGAGGGRAIGAVKGLASSVSRFVAGSLLPSLRNLGVAVAPTFRALGGLLTSIVVPAFRAVGSVLTGVVGPALTAVTGFLARHKTVLEGVLTVVGAGVAAYAALRAPMLVMTGVVRGIAIATRLWAAGQAVLNMELSANPIGIVIVAVAALVAGLIFAYRHSQTFRGIVDGAFRAVGAAALWLWNIAIKPAFTAIGAIIDWVRGHIWVLFGLPVIGQIIFFATLIIRNMGLIKAVFVALGQAAVWLWTTAIVPAFNGIVLAGRILFTVLATLIIAPLVIAFNRLKAVVLAVWQYAFVPAWHGIQVAAEGAWILLSSVLGAIGVGLRAVGSAASWLWRSAIVPAWNGIFLAIRVYGAAVRAVFAGLVAVVRSTLGPVFRWLYNNVIRPTWSAAGAVIHSVYTAVIQPTFNALKSAVSAVRSAFSVAVDAIGRIWNGLKAKTRGPVQFVVDVVYNNGIRKVWNTVAGLVHLPQLGAVEFATGGVFPGYTPGRDPYQMPMAAFSGGESVFRPEFTRAVGSDFVHAANAVARKRGVAGVRDFLLGSDMGSAHGGIVGGAVVQQFDVGGILGAVRQAASFVVHSASSLLDAGASVFAKHILNPILSRIPGAHSTWATAILSLPKRMIFGFTDWLAKAIDPKLGGDPLGVVAAAKKYVGVGDDRGTDNNNRFTRQWGYPAGTPWCALFASTAIKDAHAGTHFPGYPTAAVAGYSTRMRHVGISAGRPGDLAVYGRGTGSHINIIEKRAGSAYMTIGGNQNALVQRTIRGGQSQVLRPSYARGGILTPHMIRQIFHREAPHNADPHEMDTPLVKLLNRIPAAAGTRLYNLLGRNHLTVAGAGTFDNGGLLHPGLNVIYNGTRRPERVLTDGQWAAIFDAARDNTGGDTYNFYPRTLEMTVADLEVLQRRQETLARVGRPR